MKKRLFATTLCALGSMGIIYAQSSLPVFGQFGRYDMEYKECSFDKDAEAVILIDEARADYDDDYRLIITRRVRIKILNEKGIDRANIRIPFYSKDHYEFIRDVSAVGITPDGSGGYQNVAVDKKGFFTENVNALYSQVKFAVPSVKTGSIIEYQYVSVKKSYGGLDEWRFQSDLPVVKSCLTLQIPPRLEITYNVQKKRKYPIEVKSFDGEGRIYFEMDNIPGLESEPYMDAVKDYLQRVEFQVSGFNHGGYNQKINQTWKALGYDLATDRNFGGAIRKEFADIDELKLLAGKAATEEEKVNMIYRYVKDNMHWDHIYSLYASQPLKKAWEKRSGNAGEINLLLINLLQDFDIETYPMLVAERDYGKINVDYPFLDRFNKVVAYSIINGKNYIMDATELYCPPRLIPYSLLNTIGFIVKKKDASLVEIKSGQSYRNSITIKGRLDEDGKLTAEAGMTSSDYARQAVTVRIKEGKESYFKYLADGINSGITIDSVLYENLDEENQPLRQQIRFTRNFDEDGGFVFLPYNFFNWIQKNPFTKDERFTNVNFGYPYQINLNEEIEIPQSAVVEKLPADATITSPNNEISLVRKIRQEGKKLVISMAIVQKTTLVTADSYDWLKDTYRQMVEKLNEPIVIKAKS